MPASLTTYDAALKDNYGPGLRNALNNVNAILNEVPINTEDIVGRQAVWAAHTGRSASTGNRGESASLPAAASQAFSQLSRKLVFGYHTIKCTGPALHLTKGDDGAFLRALESELKGAESDIKFDRARQTFGLSRTDGTNLQTGGIGIVSAVATPVVTMATMTKAEMRVFFIGERIDFINPATGLVRANTPAGGYTITAINVAATTVTFSQAIDASVIANDYIIRFGNWATEIDGLRTLVSTQKYAGVDPATVPVWGAVTDGSAASTISEVLLNEAAEKVMTDGDGSVPNIWVCEFDQRRKLAAQLQAQKRYDAMQTTLPSGWKGVDIAQGTLVVDRFCPTTIAFGLTTSELARYVGMDWSWDDDSGSVLYKALDDSDAVQARYRVYDQLAAPNRNSHVALTLAVPVF